MDEYISTFMASESTQLARGCVIHLGGGDDPARCQGAPEDQATVRAWMKKQGMQVDEYRAALADQPRSNLHDEKAMEI
jgi:hypothetical protein